MSENNIPLKQPGEFISQKEILSFFDIYIYVKLNEKLIDSYVLVPKDKCDVLKGTYYIGCKDKVKELKKDSDELYSEFENKISSKDKEIIKINEAKMFQDAKSKIYDWLLKLNPHNIYYNVTNQKKYE